MATRHRILTISLTLGIASGCSSSPLGVLPPEGSERGRCLPNGSCNPGLSCASGYCVRLPDQGPSPLKDAGPDSKVAWDTRVDRGNDHRQADTMPGCGDGKKNGSESCDGTDLGGATCQSHGYFAGSLKCKLDCSFDTSACTNCGNGVVDAGETCDGSELKGQTCSSTGFEGGSLQCAKDCKLDTSGCYKCGDGKLNGAEQCDGNQVGSKTCGDLGFYAGTLKCKASCTYDTAACHNCGNGAVDVGEQCDGINLAGKTCVSQGHDSGNLACNANCSFSFAGCQKCGNGAVEGSEQCDGVALAGKTCLSLGYQGGTLSCSAGCTLDSSACFKCGDGKLNGSEACDGSLFGGKTCATQGFDGGSLACSSACALDTSGCYKCGDGKINGLEECDAAALGGKTCATVGFDGGTLSCKANCAFDKTKCYKCGNGVIEGPEECDDGNTLNGDGCSSTCKITDILGAASGTSPRLAMAGDGTFMLVWDQSWDIFAQRFKADGTKQGTAIKVNQVAVCSNPDVAMVADGRAVVVWNSGDVYGQRFDPAGNKVGPEFVVNTYTAAEQWYPSVALDSVGNFTVVWATLLSSGHDGIYGQRFKADGSKNGSEFQVHSISGSDFGDPTIAMTSTGAAVVSWSRCCDSSGALVNVRRYDSAGGPIGVEFQANVLTQGNQNLPQTMVAADGSFTVAWYNQDKNLGPVVQRRYSNSATPVGPETQVTSTAYVYVPMPRGAMAPDGRYVVTWTEFDSAAASGMKLMGQRFNANGLPEQAPFQMNKTACDNYAASSTAVAISSTGRFAFAWTCYNKSTNQYPVYVKVVPAFNSPL